MHQLHFKHPLAIHLNGFEKLLIGFTIMILDLECLFKMWVIHYPALANSYM